jgi:7-cyano-7-deazaguanine reductase
MPTQPSKSLETFSNPAPQRDYEISFDCPEFTCLCPLTGQPDFANIKIRYVPDQRCVELKSLKLYLWSYRNEGAFHEAVVNRILDDLVGALAPRRAVVEGHFFVRGGITTVVTATHEKARHS